MSVRIPVRQLAQPGVLSSIAKPPSTILLTPFSQRRTLFGRKKKEPIPTISNPVVEEYLKSEAAKLAAGPAAEPERPDLPQGTLSPSSIFSDVLPNVGKAENVPMRPLGGETKEGEPQQHGAVPQTEIDAHTHSLMRMKLDPDPHARHRWERKIVIRSIRRRGRLTKPQQLMRTERESTYTSPFLSTSVKKLTLLMRQIAGKTLDEALVQMRFSKKKVARDVVRGLEIARDAAIAGRGMGVPVPEEDRKGKEIELKGGKRKVVTDPTEIYIDQAWVGKGGYSLEPEYRAKGQINMLMHRTTSFSVLLKEEKTRMRISEEIKKKRDNRKLWVALPDRPITSQRQYCLW
ncbi:ribosomal protein L22 [Delitschia confertaspora ATCC 74209]|uniref:Ribosomal protein L22 n=1 Tax=Delitschia confertaspora ATCC 74209 TaxID=1513339 RepID=A0A9P4MR82_9PLEO|nr:ribosomal protein L22 [Delitschia confertaspora ATCC 74209]